MSVGTEQLGNITVDFIGIGVRRAGTTWLSQCLGEHPQICLSQPKETHFFDQYGGHPYASYFTHCAGGLLKGEFSPSYYLNPAIGRMIAKTFPDVKIIICLRDPIGRAISHYAYNKNKYGAKESLSKILENPAHPYIDEGFYYKHLKPFLEYFNTRTQVLFIFHEEMKRNPHKAITDTYSFLGVDHTFVPPSLGMEVNATRHSAYFLPPLNRYMKHLKKRLQRTEVGRHSVSASKKLGMHYLARFLMRMNQRENEVQAEGITAQQKEHLKNLYQEDSKRLGEAYHLRIPWL